MSYENNVKALCKEMGIQNPIKEEDVTVRDLSFLIDDTWWLVPGSDMNLAGRIFFQQEVPYTPLPACLRSAGTNKAEPMYNRAQTYFDERWDDAEEVGRSMIVALKRATHVKVHWKT